MRVLRDLSGADLVKRLGRMEYKVTRQTGSHLRLTSSVGGGHHVTIPNHDPLRVGTLAVQWLLRIMASRAMRSFNL